MDWHLLLEISAISFVQNLIYAYFISRFLYTPNRKKSFLQVFLFYQIVTTPVSYMFFYIIPVKFIANTCLMLLCVFLFFKEETTYRKVLSVILQLVVIVGSEVLLLGGITLINGAVKAVDPSSSLPQTPLIYLFQYVLFFLLFQMILKVFDRSRFFESYGKRYLLLCFCIQVMMSFLASLSFTNFSYTPAFTVVLAVLTLLIFGSYFILFYLIYKQKQKEQRDRTRSLLEKEYEQQLERYMQMDNEEQLALLRHDLIHWMEEA